MKENKIDWNNKEEVKEYNRQRANKNYQKVKDNPEFKLKNQSKSRLNYNKNKDNPEFKLKRKDYFKEHNKNFWAENKDNVEFQLKRKKQKAESYQKNKVEILKKCKEYRAIPEVRVRRKVYDQSPKSKEIRKRFYEKNQKNNPEYKLNQQKYQRKYHQLPEVKLIHNQSSIIHNRKYPKKVKAREIANTHLKHLRPKGYEFHHPDYNKPLNVQILTIKEHRQLHVQQNMINKPASLF